MQIILFLAALCSPLLPSQDGKPEDAVCQAPAQQPQNMCSDNGRSCSVDRNCCSGNCDKGSCK